MTDSLNEAKETLGKAEITAPSARCELYTKAAAQAQIAQAEILKQILQTLKDGLSR